MRFDGKPSEPKVGVVRVNILSKRLRGLMVRAS